MKTPTLLITVFGLALAFHAPAQTPPVPTPESPRKEGYLGVATVPVPPPLTAQLNLDPGFGLLVVEVLEDGPAEKAGVIANEVLTKFDDQLLAGAEQLSALVKNRAPGTPVVLTSIRGGQPRTVTATIEERSAMGGRTEDTLISVPMPLGFGAEDNPFSPGEALSPEGATMTALREGNRDYLLTRNGRERVFIVKDRQGANLFKEVLSTDEGMEQIPGEYRAVFKKLNVEGGTTSAMPVMRSLNFDGPPPYVPGRGLRVGGQEPSGKDFNVTISTGVGVVN